MPDTDSANQPDGGFIPEFEEVKTDVAEGKAPTRSVREILRWFGALRRGTYVVERIEAELEAAGLRTEPHFASVWIDEPVTFWALKTLAVAAPTDENDQQTEPKGDGGGSSSTDKHNDATHLVRMLGAANRQVTFVNPQDPIERAITLMLAHDYSQLAVMTGTRDLKGAISWKTVGSRLSQRNELKHVSDAMEPAVEVLDTDTLFAATNTVIQRDYAFVRSSADRTIKGIVTATDLSEQFQVLSEPFLLLGRIENQLRRVIQEFFDIDTMRAACDEKDPKRKATISKASQLNFGEYQRIFEREENWEKLRFVACRKTFCTELDGVRKLRNEIMHFHPDVTREDNFEPLRRFSRLIEQLRKLAG